MQLSSSPSRVVPFAYHGADERRIVHPTKLRIQYTGPGEETILQEGPDEGKTWDVTVKVFVQELDA